MATLQPTSVNPGDDQMLAELNFEISDDGTTSVPANMLEDALNERLFETHTVTLGSGDSTSEILVLGASSVVAVCTGAAKWEIKNSASTLAREFSGVGLSQNPTSTVCGIIVGVNMPHAVRLTDTSGSSNVVCIFVYR